MVGRALTARISDRLTDRFLDWWSSAPLDDTTTTRPPAAKGRAPPPEPLWARLAKALPERPAAGVAEKPWWTRRKELRRPVAALAPRAAAQEAAPAPGPAAPAPPPLPPPARQAEEPERPARPTHYTVRAGDTAWEIALDHRVSLAALSAKNGGRDLAVLAEGDSLALPAVGEVVALARELEPERRVGIATVFSPEVALAGAAIAVAGAAILSRSDGPVGRGSRRGAAKVGQVLAEVSPRRSPPKKKRRGLS